MCRDTEKRLKKYGVKFSDGNQYFKFLGRSDQLKFYIYNNTFNDLAERGII